MGENMAEERFILIQNGNDFTVLDTVKEKHMGVFEFKEDEFPVYFCFHKIIDLLNRQHEEIRQLQRHLDVMRSGALSDDKRIKELYEENEQLKKEIKAINDFIILEPLGDANDI